MNLLLFLLGLAALVAGAELLVRGAARLALSFGVSPLVVGLTIVAFGTSAPEVAVSIGAVASGTTDLAVGNVVGSNIFNVLLILGLAALISPLCVHVQIIRQEVPMMTAATLVLAVLVLDGQLSRAEAGLLLAVLIAYSVFLVRQSRAAPPEEQAEYEKSASHSRWDRHWAVQWLLVAGGLVLLVLGSDWLVEAAVAFAQALGVSDVVIGLTVVAAGTSMPEVATSVMATLRGERDIAVGNVIGSNLFNILGCLGVSGLVASGGLAVPPAVLHFDLWVMTAAMLACLPVFMTGREIARWEGAVFLGYYLAYTAYLILAAQQHAALGAYSQVMMSFVIPLTIVTLVAVMIRPRPG
ncbi:calcium/sodium antiporter [Schlegelella sp. S2-27]|uniref:Calcium/sodium antiporter n=1 Tax=Caldimonas mangrovi TaxID=2944811 RepID=A0ABT0YV88_9BURK|nr:calcium/sodium antiporter [Caldimonas mangrovi]MCM5682319.1 calcium/sodium antiporter [Caldimonas mangrovi]